MNKDFKKFAPAGLYLSLIAAAVSLGLYVVERKISLPLQISLGIIVLGLALTVFLDPQKAKEAITGRQGRNSSNAFLMVVAVLGILAVINYLGYTNPKSWDLTEGQKNSLTPETIEILNKLPSKVTITGFYSTRFSRETATQLFEKYKSAANGNFDYKYIDPDADPAAAQKAQITAMERWWYPWIAAVNRSRTLTRKKFPMLLSAWQIQGKKCVFFNRSWRICIGR